MIKIPRSVYSFPFRGRATVRAYEKWSIIHVIFLYIEIAVVLQRVVKLFWKVIHSP
jgi:hypothetical protein